MRKAGGFGSARIILPLVQMVLAALLLRLSFLRDFATRYHDSPGVHPGFILLLYLNLPISIPLKLLLYGRLPTLWFDTAFVAMVGMLWYGVASCIAMYRERRTVVPTDRAWLRASVDLLWIAMGVFIAWMLVEELSSFRMTVFPAQLGGWFWSAAVCGSLLFWSAGSIVIFGYDLGNCVRSLMT